MLVAYLLRSWRWGAGFDGTAASVRGRGRPGRGPHDGWPDPRNSAPQHHLHAFPKEVLLAARRASWGFSLPRRSSLGAVGGPKWADEHESLSRWHPAKKCHAEWASLMGTIST